MHMAVVVLLSSVVTIMNSVTFVVLAPGSLKMDPMPAIPQLVVSLPGVRF